MHGEMEVLFSLAGRVHVLLRREINRMIDVAWLCCNAEYAREAVRLAREVGSDELQKLAGRIEEVHPLLAYASRPRAPSLAVIAAQDENKYVATLR
jgi:hypothetical protein